MNRFVMADPQGCIGCKTCLAACSEAHKTEGLQRYPRLSLVKTATQTAPVLCRHCEDAPCLQVCPVNVISVRDEAVQLDETLCIGCKLCGLVCPFGTIASSGSRPVNAPAWFTHPLPDSPPRCAQTLSALHPYLRQETGVKTVAVKCDLCYFRPDGPACVQVCPTRALHLVDGKRLYQRLHAKRQRAADCPDAGGPSALSLTTETR